MSKTNEHDSDRQLHTLERWRRLELETAQAEHISRQAIEQERQAERDAVAAGIEKAQDFTRGKCGSGAALSPQTLLLAMSYAQQQQRELASAERALEQSQEQVRNAHSDVVSRAEHLFGIEKLRERRRELRTKEAAMDSQKELDASALLKLNGDTDQRDT